MVRRFLTIFSLALLLSFPLVSFSAQKLSTFLPDKKIRIVTLQSALELATHNNLDLASVLAKLEQASSREQQAFAALLPKVTGTGVLSPIYKTTGNALQTETDTSVWGIWVQGALQILQPLYSWGKISNLRSAAQFGSKFAEAEVKKSKAELSYEVKELFYGSIMADQLFIFLSDGKNDLEKILKKAEDDQASNKPKIAKRDYYRLKVFSAEADYRFEEAQKLRQLSRFALSLKLGFNPEEETVPNEATLTPILEAPPSENILLAKMIDSRPELQMLRNGILAKKALLAVEEANRYPNLFLGGLVNLAYSNVRDTQQSTFAFDPYNRIIGGVGLGLQWNFDFATTLANESYVKAEIDELEKKQVYALTAVRLELQKCLSNLSAAKNVLKKSEEGFKIGKKWLISETMGYSVGLSEVKNLIDAYLARAKTTQDYWGAIYKLNIAWADLVKTVGQEFTPGLTPAK